MKKKDLLKLLESISDEQEIVFIRTEGEDKEDEGIHEVEIFESYDLQFVTIKNNTIYLN